MNKILAACIALSLLCACGEGGGSSITPSQPGSSGTASSHQTATLTLRFNVGSPSSSKTRPAYVSGNATQLIVLVNTVNGSSTLPSGVAGTTTIGLTTTGTSPNCAVAGSVETCTAQVPAPPGSVSYTFNLEDASNDLLATATQTFTITSGTANALSLSLGGVVATVTVSGPSPLFVPGTGATSTLTVTAKDASGYTIGGSTAYDNPFTLTIADTSGATKLTVNGGTAATTVTVNAPTDVVAVVYSGEATSNATIGTSTANVTASGTLVAAAGTITLPSGTLPDDAGNGGLVTDPNWNQPTVFFSSTGVQQTFTAQEAGWTNAPYSQTLTVTLDPTSCGSGGSAVASIASSTNVGGADSIVVNGNNSGFCEVTLSDPFLASITLWISVTASNFSINGVHRPR
ncbi:MAG TPA: hypothetical protein VMG98_09155 [Verrucomicrobiae bacterium]|nr:hypothetical protein [Verrucomicrobiae bacterium]